MTMTADTAVDSVLPGGRLMVTAKFVRQPYAR
jgi:hypothetical protein